MDVPAVVTVLTQREVPWLPEVAQRLNDGMTSRNRDDRWPLIAALVRATGVPVPTGDQFVLGWLESIFDWQHTRERGHAGRCATTRSASRCCPGSSRWTTPARS
ncbi:hypothetical protein ACFQX7_11115 [Luedemannella flava]